MESENKRKLVLRRYKMLNKLISLHGRKCWYCGIRFTSFKEVEIDHIVPKVRGGKDVIGNYAIACVTCNRGKSTLPLEEFLAYLRRPKQPLPFLHERAKSCEQHWRDWGEEIEKGLRKPSNAKVKSSDRRVAYDVRIVPVDPVDVTPT